MPIISSEALKLNLCEKCNTDFYQKENVPTYKNGYINCYKKIDGYKKYWTSDNSFPNDYNKLI